MFKLIIEFHSYVLLIKFTSFDLIKFQSSFSLLYSTIFSNLLFQDNFAYYFRLIFREHLFRRQCSDSRYIKSAIYSRVIQSKRGRWVFLPLRKR